MAVLSRLLLDAVLWVLLGVIGVCGVWISVENPAQSGQPAPPGQPAACAGGVTVLLNGTPLSTGCVLNLKAGTGILAAPAPNPGIGGTDLVFSINPAVVAEHADVIAGEHYCPATSPTTAYACQISAPSIPQVYQTGMEVLLYPSATCYGSATACTLNLTGPNGSGALGVKSITEPDGVTPANQMATGGIVNGQAKRLWYDGVVFRVE